MEKDFLLEQINARIDRLRKKMEQGLDMMVDLKVELIGIELLVEKLSSFSRRVKPRETAIKSKHKISKEVKDEKKD